MIKPANTTEILNNLNSSLHGSVKKTVISLLLSGINISLAVSLEMWTKTCGLIPLLLFEAAGFILCFLLTFSFLTQKERRLKIHALLWGVLMTCAYVLGCRMRRDGTALKQWSHLPFFLAQTACLSVFAAACIAPFLQGFPRIRQLTADYTCKNIAIAAPLSTDANRQGYDHKYKHYDRRALPQRRPFGQIWLFSTVMILLSFIPIFLAYYPSVFAYDAEGQLYQVLAHDYSTHHPLLHTLFLGFFFQIGGSLFGSYSTGMAIHSIVQMLLMASAFGYTLAFLYKKGLPLFWYSILLLFYALFPVNSVLALSTTKDVLFSALVLLHTLFLYRLLIDQNTAAGISIKLEILYVCWTILLLLFRNNALYALALSMPVIGLFLFRTERTSGRLWRRYLILTLLALALSVAGNRILIASLDAHNGSPREMLSIPLQQMARTRVKAEETMPLDLQQEVERYLPAEWVFAAYNPYLADPVKNRAIIHDDPAGLIKTWIRLGLQYPQIYLDAFLDNSIGYWFLEDHTHAQIYGIGIDSGFGYLSTDNRTMPAGCEIIEHSLLPGLRRLMEQIVSDNVYQQLPLLRVIFAPAFYWWLLCLYAAVVLYRKKYFLLLPAVFLAAYYLTLLLSPAVLIRYMYPFVVTVPVLCCLLFCQTHES